MPRKATVGPEIYERVNALLRTGKKRTEAFAQVAQERGSRPGSVAANYYRIAGTASQPKSRRISKERRGKATSATARRPRSAQAQPRASTQSDITQIAKQIAELTDQLVRRVEARDKQLRQLLG